jgi:hypothetical protein
MARADWETPPTVEGRILNAEISEMGDVLYVQGEEVAEDIGHLLQVIDDPEAPNPNRPFCVVGKAGTLKFHDYTKVSDLVGKRCLLYSEGRFDMVSIEKPNGEQGELVIWCEYI